MNLPIMSAVSSTHCRCCNNPGPGTLGHEAARRPGLAVSEQIKLSRGLLADPVHWLTIRGCTRDISESRNVPRYA
jgi:hypothetical protein